MFNGYVKLPEGRRLISQKYSENKGKECEDDPKSKAGAIQKCSFHETSKRTSICEGGLKLTKP